MLDDKRQVAKAAQAEQQRSISLLEGPRTAARAIIRRESDERREAERERLREQYKRPEWQVKRRAWAIVRRALKNGQLVRGRCVRCGCAETQAHHYDHEKPLVVTWLCKEHHDAISKRKQQSLAAVRRKDRLR